MTCIYLEPVNVLFFGHCPLLYLGVPFRNSVPSLQLSSPYRRVEVLAEDGSLYYGGGRNLSSRQDLSNEQIIAKENDGDSLQLPRGFQIAPHF